MTWQSVAIKSTKITAIGGVFLVEDEINRLQIPKLVDYTLGKRGMTKCSFKHGDVFKSLFMSYLYSADCTEDINYLEVDLDFDHQFIAAHKYDAKYSYKQDFGYSPGWAMVDGIIVGGENRDGNANVRFKQEETLERIMSRMERVLNVKIGRFCADCSYSRNVFETV